MQAAFNGQLGKQSSSMIAPLISSKMPGGFNSTTARKYLTDQYGLQSSRQDSALMLAITMEPAARLGSEGDAMAFLDNVVTKHATSAGILLSGPAAAGAAASASDGMMMDPPAVIRLYTPPTIMEKYSPASGPHLELRTTTFTP